MNQIKNQIYQTNLHSQITLNTVKQQNSNKFQIIFFEKINLFKYQYKRISLKINKTYRNNLKGIKNEQLEIIRCDQMQSDAQTFETLQKLQQYDRNQIDDQQFRSQNNITQQSLQNSSLKKQDDVSQSQVKHQIAGSQLPRRGKKRREYKKRVGGLWKIRLQDRDFQSDRYECFCQRQYLTYMALYQHVGRYHPYYFQIHRATLSKNIIKVKQSYYGYNIKKLLDDNLRVSVAPTVPKPPPEQQKNISKEEKALQKKKKKQQQKIAQQRKRIAEEQITQCEKTLGKINDEYLKASKESQHFSIILQYYQKKLAALIKIQQNSEIIVQSYEKIINILKIDELVEDIYYKKEYKLQKEQETLKSNKKQCQASQIEQKSFSQRQFQDKTIKQLENKQNQ